MVCLFAIARLCPLSEYGSYEYVIELFVSVVRLVSLILLHIFYMNAHASYLGELLNLFCRLQAFS